MSPTLFKDFVNRLECSFVSYSVYYETLKLCTPFQKEYLNLIQQMKKVKNN